MSASKAQIRASNKYNKDKTLTICLRLNKETDKDIIDYLDRLHFGGESKQGKVKDLIRKQIEEDLKDYKRYLDD